MFETNGIYIFPQHYNPPFGEKEILKSVVWDIYIIPVSFFLLIHSCLAGENVHFYDEVHELGKIPLEDPVRRIYMTRHIIEKYIKAGL